MQFTISGTDFSGHIPAGSYEVNDVDVYESWTDANYREHREKFTSKVSGSVDLFFKTETEFNAFRNALNLSKAEDLTHRITLTCNNTGSDKEIDAFLDYSLVRNIAGNWQDYFEMFALKIREA